MGAVKRRSETRDEVVEKLLDGHYDRVLEGFEAQIDAAADTLRRALAAMKAENTLQS